jgi:hypothetical protein
MIGSNEKVSHRVEWWDLVKVSFVEMQSSYFMDIIMQHLIACRFDSTRRRRSFGWSASSFYFALETSLTNEANGN